MVANNMLASLGIKKKLRIQLEVAPVEEEEAGFVRPDATVSIGSLPHDGGDLWLVSDSLQQYKFTESGLHKTTSNRPTSAGKFFQISDKDITILGLLGQGASSAVYKAYFPRGNAFVAIKRINCLEKEKRHQIMNDVRALCDVNHPGLVQFIGAYHLPENGQIAIVLEHMDGGSLADVLHKVKQVPEGILSVICGQVLHGLMYIHKVRHTVHRDIKPANILMNGQGLAKIADFGISAFVDNTLAVCHTFLGTVTYMSPERINSQPYSFPADIWSLGLTLLECALGRYPYDASAGPLMLMMQVMSEPVPLPAEGECSPEFRGFVEQCLQKDPLKRPTAEALLGHPFIQQHQGKIADLRNIMVGASSANDRLEEQAMVLTNQFYQSLSGGRSQLPSLAGILTVDTVLVHEGVEVSGWPAVLERLQSICSLQAALGVRQLAVDDRAVQPLAAGGALVHVTGHMVVEDFGPLGAAMTDGGPPALFSQAFELQQQASGAMLITKSIFRHL